MARKKRKIVTDENSNDEVAPCVKPRPRKKQAVTKTNSTAVKTLIRKNATTSPLLQLPSEVRENILTHLVGDNLIHVKFFDINGLYITNKAKNEYLGIDFSQGARFERRSNYSAYHTDNDGGDDGVDGVDGDDGDNGDNIRNALFFAASASPPARETAFRHAICVANQSEQSAYDEAVSDSAILPDGESPDHYVASCTERHEKCKMCGKGPMFLCEDDRQTLRIDLNVLGVCRQLYEEANHLLWATNTFSFEDPKTLGKFLGSLNPAQKRNLTRIHISADIGVLGSYYYPSASQRARWDSGYWGKGLKIPHLNMLRGVQILHLCINQVFECLTPRFNSDSAEEAIETTQKADMESILRLRALAVRHVTVIVSDDACSLEKFGRSAYRWTVEKKNEYAESIRVQLVDPAGAELVKVEAESASFARRLEIRDNASVRLEEYKQILTNKRADVVRLAKWASREEASAASTAQKASQVLKTSSKKAAKLRDAAQKQKKRAMSVRDAANAAGEKKKYWQEQVANVRQKYLRANAGLGAMAGEIEISSGSEMNYSEDDVAQADRNIKSEGDESLLFRPEDETSVEDDEASS